MPFYDDEENNNPFTPSVEQSTYGFSIDAIQRQEQNKPDYTFSEEFGAGFEAENWLYREVLKDEEQTDVERAMSQSHITSPEQRRRIGEQIDNFDYLPYVRDKDNDFADWYANTASENDVRIIQSRIDEQLQNREIINNGGIGTGLGMVTGAVMSPELLIPVVGEIALASKVKTGVSIAKLVASNVAADGVHELINYNTDRTYQQEQIGYAMLGSVVLNGIFGGFAFKGVRNMAKAEADTDRLISNVTDDIIDLGSDFDPYNARHAGAAETMESAWELKADDLLRKMHSTGLGQNKAMFLPNNLMGALSKSQIVRKVTGLLYENSFYYKDNIAGRAMPASAELRLQKHKGRIVDAYKKSEKLYKDYVTNTAQPLSKADFRMQVSRAIRNGTDEDAHVAKAARMYKKTVFSPLADEAKRLGLLGDDLDPNYLTRVWKREAVLANRPVFKEKLVTFFKTQTNNAEVDDQTLEELADETIKNILGGDIMKGAMIASGAGGTNPLKKRVLDITDDLVEDFIENDIELLTKRYVDNLSVAIEKENFLKDNGWEKLGDIEVEIRNEYNQLIDAATDPAVIKKLEEEKAEAITFAAQSVERVFRPATSKAVFDNAVSNVMKLSTLSKLGSVLLSSIGDIGRITQEFGHVGLGNGIKLMLSRATKGLKKEEYGRIGALTERVLNERYNALSGIDDVTGTGLISRTIDTIYKSFGKVTGMEYWNDGIKTMAIYAGEHSILKNASKLVSGQEISEKAVAELARWGISKDVAERIGNQFAAHGNLASGLMESNFEKWDDMIALDAFSNALTKMSLQVVNTPTKGTLPQVFDSTLGKAIMQFKSFMFASHVQTLVPMLQTPDAKRMVGMAEMIGIGSMMYYVKEHAYNEEPDVGDWKKIIAEGVDRSGVFALPFEINNIVEKATHGTVGIRPTFGLGEAQRMRNVNVVGALAGPLAGMSSDAAIPLGHAFQGDMTKGDVSRMARLMPYQNLFYTRWLTDKLKRGIQDDME